MHCVLFRAKLCSQRENDVTLIYQLGAPTERQYKHVGMSTDTTDISAGFAFLTHFLRTKFCEILKARQTTPAVLGNIPERIFVELWFAAVLFLGRFTERLHALLPRFLASTRYQTMFVGFCRNAQGTSSCRDVITASQ